MSLPELFWIVSVIVITYPSVFISRTNLTLSVFVQTCEPSFEVFHTVFATGAVVPVANKPASIKLSSVSSSITGSLLSADFVKEGDKVICLRNYWEEMSLNEGDPLVNGTIGYLKNCLTL